MCSTYRKGFLGILVSAACLATLSYAQERPAPNFVFILADDQSPFELRAYDPSAPLETPNLDRLASEGMTLDGAHHMGAFLGAVCTPSRHMIMCGRTLWRLPQSLTSTVYKDYPSNRCPPDIAEQTIPTVFNRAGYQTMRTCKIGNSYPEANERFSIVRDASKRGGTHDTGSAWHADQVLQFLEDREASGSEDPFFVYFGLSHPHDPRDGTPELLAKYGAANHTNRTAAPKTNKRTPPLPKNYLPAHPFHHGHLELRDEVAVSGVWDKRDEATIRNELGREYACSENIDIQIGRVLDKLDELGESSNTYVIYTSDHGIAIGRHGLTGKQNLYEHTWRVPLIVRGPGVVPGSREVGNVYLLDLLSTFCDLAGIEPPGSSDGKSFRSVLEGKQRVVRDTLYGAYCGGTKPGIRCVKQGDWKLIKYDVLDGEVRETQLFNLAENPLELLAEHHDAAVVAQTGNAPHVNQVNLAADPSYSNKLAELESLLLEEQRRLEEPYRLWNQPHDGVTPPVVRNRK